MPKRPSNRTLGGLAVLVLPLGLASAIASCSSACAQKSTGGTETPEASAELPPSAEIDASGPRREELLAAAREALARGTYDGPRIGAMNMVTSVLSMPAWPPDADAGVPRGDKVSARLGYLRHGAKVPALGLPPIINEGCTEGWYELVQGGYICGKAATLDLKHPRVRLAPGPPDLSAGLPYRYGYNLTNGTPLYRRVLSIEDRKKYEPWLVPAPKEPAPEEGSGEAAVAEEGGDDTAAALPVPPAPKRSKTPDPAASATPWYMQKLDGGKPKVALGELRGRGVLVRRMVRGFYLALDKDFKAANAHWWRTTGGLAVPFERIFLQPQMTDFHGTWMGPPVAGTGLLDLDGGVDAGAAGARGTVVFTRFEGAHKYTVDPEKKKNPITMGEGLGRRRAAALTGVSFLFGGVAFRETTEGFWIRSADVTEVHPSPRPPEVGPEDKWIDVDVTRQTLIALEGDMPVFATYVSSGRRNLYDKEHDYPTPPGTFRIREKHVTATMDGDVAADGPYSIEDVPWVMYYQGSYALHGAFWHGQFGRQHSHGCVNLAPADARVLFNWVEPRLPEGWHGVFATGERGGTLVFVHE